MNKLLNAFLQMDALDEFAMGDTWFHRLHPLLKLISCLLWIVFVLTTPNIIELCFYLFCLFIFAYFAKISIRKIMKRGLIGLPLSLCLGLSYIVTQHQLINFVNILIPVGVILCLIVFMKTFLCLSIAYFLVCTTSFDMLASELVYLKVPAIFVLQLIMTYRYIFVFLREAQMMSQAYILRHPKARAIDIKDMGSFVGHLLIASMNQSQHIYDCMLCRGFDIHRTYTQHMPIEADSFFLMMIIFAILVLIRVVFS